MRRKLLAIATSSGWCTQLRTCSSGGSGDRPSAAFGSTASNTELSEFLSVFCWCAETSSPRFSMNSLSFLAQKSVSSPFRKSLLSKQFSVCFLVTVSFALQDGSSRKARLRFRPRFMDGASWSKSPEEVSCTTLQRLLQNTSPGASETGAFSHFVGLICAGER